eukprot:RCo008405
MADPRRFRSYIAPPSAGDPRSSHLPEPPSSAPDRPTTSHDSFKAPTAGLRDSFSGSFASTSNSTSRWLPGANPGVKLPSGSRMARGLQLLLRSSQQGTLPEQHPPPSPGTPPEADGSPTRGSPGGTALVVEGEQTGQTVVLQP